MSTTTDRLVAAFLCGLLIALVPLRAAADGLMLYPTRVVLDENQRAAQVELVNSSTKTLTYRISLVNRRMSETGEFADASPQWPGEQFADPMLRYSPRQVVLAPGASQTVRIQVRKPANLATGEYRSHLLFTQVSQASPPVDTRASAPADAKGLQIQLTPLLGVSIPVIVRHGKTQASATLANLSFERGTPGQPAVLALEAHRLGNRSLYADVVVMHTSPNGSEQALARANGVALYTPNPMRRIRIALPPSVDAGGGTLRVVLQERPEDGGKPLAQARLPLP